MSAHLSIYILSMAASFLCYSGKVEWLQWRPHSLKYLLSVILKEKMSWLPVSCIADFLKF